MSIPPEDEDPEKYFKILCEIGVKLKLKELSMGMSSDYVKALKYNSTFKNRIKYFWQSNYKIVIFDFLFKQFL